MKFLSLQNRVLKRLKARVWPRVAARLPWNSQVSYSQFGEDMVLSWLTGRSCSGFYVDIGAFHPIAYSNTYALYCRGWRGINVEPRRGVLEEFKNYRPRDTSLDLCVCPSAQSTVEFYCFVDPFLSTADPSRADKLVREGHALLDARQVPAVSLAELFTRYVPHNTAIDLLSIDVEGWDEQILRSNDWQRFKPRIVLFEQLGLRLKEIQRAPIVDFLESLGYEFVAKCGESVIMKHELTKDDSTANGQ